MVSEETTNVASKGEVYFGLNVEIDDVVIVLADVVVQRLAKLMFIPIEDIDISQPFSHFGLDSMNGSELIH